MKYQKERLTKELQAELEPLLLDHWAEIAQYSDIPMNVDWQRYYTMQRQGILQVYTARDEGKLVGYCVYMVVPHLHYSDTLYAIQDVLFLHPDYRGRTAGYRMIKFADKDLEGRGVGVIMQHVKVKHDFGPLLTRMGYEHAENIYSKRTG